MLYFNSGSVYCIELGLSSAVHFHCFPLTSEIILIGESSCIFSESNHDWLCSWAPLNLSLRKGGVPVGCLVQASTGAEPAVGLPLRISFPYWGSCPMEFQHLPGQRSCSRQLAAFFHANAAQGASTVITDTYCNSRMLMYSYFITMDR